MNTHKIKKVMREFKNGKLKTPNGEVVTDKKQALAIVTYGMY